MEKDLKLSDFTIRILANAVLLGPVAMIFFLIIWFLIEPDDSFHADELPIIFVIGSIICMFISMGASGVIYGALVTLAIRVSGSTIDHFKRFVPVLVTIFLVIGTAIWLIDFSFHSVPLAMLISAYLTAVSGWYLLSINIAKKQRNLNI